MKYFKTILPALLLAMFLISCGHSYDEIDGSSQEAYQRSLASLLSKASYDQQEQILDFLEGEYERFLSDYPAFDVSPFQDKAVRSPEYLASIDGISFSALLKDADRSIIRRQESYKISQVIKRRGKICDILKEYYAQKKQVQALDSVVLKIGQTEFVSRHGSSKVKIFSIPIEITNNNKFAIFSLSISFRIIEEGRTVPWVDTVKTENFYSGLDSGETFSRELNHRVSYGLEEDIGKKLNDLKFHIKPIMVTISSEYSTSSLDTYNQYSVQEIEALEEEKEGLLKKLRALTEEKLSEPN
jgi:hypothetical protein